MTQTPNMREPTVADALAALAASDLPEQIRLHWRSSALAIARALDQPVELIPARYSAVRARMEALHHVPLGWTPKTLANHKSNKKSLLLWFRKEKDVLPHGVALSPGWACLVTPLVDPSSRYRLMPLMRFCSGVGIEPCEVNETVIDRYLEHRERTTAFTSDTASRRVLARLWNKASGTIQGWPDTRLFEPPVKSRSATALEDFPASFLPDIELYLDRSKGVHRGKANQRIRPCKTSTLTTRRRELIGAARMAVKEGVPINTLTSLRALVDPEVVEKVLGGYWPKGTKVPPTYAINLSARFVAIAHSLTGFDNEALERLGDMRFALEEYREEGMTPKNLALIRQVLTDGVWSRVMALPKQLMQQARLKRHAPVKAAVTAQLAVVVAILTVAPIRLENLANIQLGENLIKPGGPDSNFWLTFRRYDVKNDIALEFTLDEEVTAIINEYVHDFRPALMRKRNADCLFPGMKGEHKEKISFSSQIVDRIEDATGLRITVHQFRHAAGALILKHFPGNYELVRRILGHKSIETTKKFYLSLETTQASEIFTNIVRNKLNPDRPEA